MAAGDHYRLRMIGTLRASTIEFGLHFAQVSGTGGADTLAAHWAANVTPLVTAATSVEVNWNEVVVSDVLKTGKRSVHLGLTQPLPGLITGDCLPGQNSVVVRFFTGDKGRGQHGRIYVPGISESSSSGGQVTGTQLTAIAALANGLDNFYGPGGTFAGFRMCIYSPEQLTPPRVRPFKPRPGVLVGLIEESDVDPIIRTTRRRAIGVGR